MYICLGRSVFFLVGCMYMRRSPSYGDSWVTWNVRKLKVIVAMLNEWMNEWVMSYSCQSPSIILFLHLFAHLHPLSSLSRDAPLKSHVFSSFAIQTLLKVRARKLTCANGMLENKTTWSWRQIHITSLEQEKVNLAHQDFVFLRFGVFRFLDEVRIVELESFHFQTKAFVLNQKNLE